MDLIGIVVGHAYYFLEFIYPRIAEIRGWGVKRIMEPPAVLHWLCGSYHHGGGGGGDQLHLHQD